MTTAKRLAGLCITAALLFYGIAPAVATAAEAQTSPTVQITFEPSNNVVDGTVYDLTVNGTTYSITAGPGFDKTLSVTQGSTVTWSVTNTIDITPTTRCVFLSGSAPNQFVANTSYNVAMWYVSQVKLTADQTGLPDGTQYFFNHMESAAVDILTAGTPLEFWYDLWGFPSPLVYSFQDPVVTEFGVYPLASTTPASPYTFAAGQTITAAYASGSISGFVFDDINNNGVRDAGEPGIPNATVQLWGGGEPVNLQSTIETPAPSQQIFQTGTSGSDGSYDFGGVPAGTFFVRALLPGGGQQDSKDIILVISGSGVTTGTADFPQTVAAATLPYTGL
jgi:hypothetical protein